MVKILSPLLVALLSVSFVLAAEGKKEGGFDPAKLVGDWTFESGKKSGEAVDKDRLKGTVKITKETITLPGPTPDASFVIGYKINTKTSPATIDMEIKDGPVKEGKALGLIDMKGDEFTLAYVAVMDADAKRPTKLESTKENNAFLFVLKKAKK